MKGLYHSYKSKVNNFVMSQMLNLAFRNNNRFLRERFLLPALEKKIRKIYEDQEHPVNITEDKFHMMCAILHSGLRAEVSSKFSNLLFKDILSGEARKRRGAEFHKKFGFGPPAFMTISPAKGCNLQCTGCYANSGENVMLEYEVFLRIIEEMRELWGSRFVVISGGEPLMYRWNGKSMVDVFRHFSDSLFLMYTNGTLIDEDVARRFAECGNITPAISVEGLKETTERRRGRGVFERILNAMKFLRAYKVPFGISVTATSNNAEEVVSEEFIDFYFTQYGAAYGWLFHYMPIGRDIELHLIPTPKQRTYLWERTWEIVKERKIMYVDFWNHGTVSGGCISGGRDGGYLYCDWNGDIYPCVFFPYSTANIYKIYEKGGNLNDIINLPLHSKIRNWQLEYRGSRGDLLRPCPIRDHYITTKGWLCHSEGVKPADSAALEILQDKTYEDKMSLYDEMLKEETTPIWREKYLEE